MKRGDRYLAYGEERPVHRLFIAVTRVARDGSWADIVVQTWAVQWRKRQPLTDGTFPFAKPYNWTAADLEEQMDDHDAWLEEQATGVRTGAE